MDELINYWYNQYGSPSDPSGCGPFSIAMAADLIHGDPKYLTGWDVERRLDRDLGKIPGIGMPSWWFFSENLSSITGKPVQYESGSSIWDLQYALLNKELPVVAVAWESDSQLHHDIKLDLNPYEQYIDEITNMKDINGNIKSLCDLSQLGKNLQKLNIGHYMVAVGFDSYQGRLYFLDPGSTTGGITHYSYQEWDTKWRTGNVFIQAGAMWKISP
jgi:hypothetical protein